METTAAERILARLKAGAGTYACGGYLAGLDDLQRTELFTALLFDRLARKMRLVEALRGEADENWNQTFYLLYFRTLGDRQNQEAYLSLARRVPYRTVLRERLAPRAVEAMLFGASGLLELYRHDEYTLDLRREFEHLSAKYGIEPMDASAWELGNIRPANHPVLRLAQAAQFFTQDEFVMARTMACRTEGDIRTLFCIEPSRPTSSASTWLPCCSSPTAAARATSGCATAPCRSWNDSRPKTTASCGPGGRRACRSATPSSRRRCCSSPPNTAPQNAARSAPRDAVSCGPAPPENRRTEYRRGPLHQPFSPLYVPFCGNAPNPTARYFAFSEKNHYFCRIYNPC